MLGFQRWPRAGDSQALPSTIGGGETEQGTDTDRREIGIYEMEDGRVGKRVLLDAASIRYPQNPIAW